MRSRLTCKQDTCASKVCHTRAKTTCVTSTMFNCEKFQPRFSVATRSLSQCQVRGRACHTQRGFVEVVIWGRLRMKNKCYLFVQIHRKSRNVFVQPCPSPTLALLLSSCKLRTWLPWPSLWHVANTKGQFVLHDLLFI